VYKKTLPICFQVSLKRSPEGASGPGPSEHTEDRPSSNMGLSVWSSVRVVADRIGTKVEDHNMNDHVGLSAEKRQ